MTERVALVTGAGRGIGRAIALELAGRGYDIGINYLSNADEAKQTLRLVEEKGRSGICLQADVGKDSDVERCFGEVKDALGSVSVLVNNAGTRHDGLALSLSYDAWDQVIKTNLYGTFSCCRRALRPMVRARFGRIVNITSGSVKMPIGGLDLSSGARAGLTAFLAGVARSVASANVTINNLLPGTFETDRLRSNIEAGAKKRNVPVETARQERLATVPAARFGDPAEFGATCAFLCSAHAGYITGQNVLMDGGVFPGAF